MQKKQFNSREKTYGRKPYFTRLLLHKKNSQKSQEKLYATD